MASLIRVLIIEDSESDAELLKHHLEKAGLRIASECIEDEKALNAALDAHGWDLIISDFNLPGFNAFSALSIVQATGRDIPFIIVSGTINEEKAIELLRMGASDYLMKDNLTRLAPAVKRELAESAARQNHRRAQDDLKKSQARYKLLFDQAPYGILIVDSETTMPIEFNDVAHQQLGYSREEFYQTPISAFEAVESAKDVATRIEHLLINGGDEFDTLHRTKQGEIRSVHVILQIVEFEGKKLQHCVFQDITERKQAENALKVSEASFEDIFQTVEEGIAYTTLTGDVISVNNALVNIINIPQDEIVGKNILAIAKKLLSVKMVSQVLPRLMRMINGEGVEPFEVEYGNKILEIRSLYNKQSRHITGVIRDITERKLAEKKIKENEALLSAMVSNISDVIAILDIKGIVKYKSPNIESFFGWKPEEMIGKSGFITVHPDDLPCIQENFQTLLHSENQPLSMEYRYFCKDGSYRPVKLNAVNLINDPDINGILLNYHDITERRQMEKAMLKAEEKFRLAFFSSPDAISINRQDDGLFLEVNTGFTAMFGFSYEEVVGKTSKEVDIWVNSDDRVRLLNILRENGKVVNFEAQFRKKDGTILACLMTSNIIEINGEACILHNVRDISDRRRMEMDLSKAEEKFRKAFETSPDCINIIRMRDGMHMDINTGFLELTGYTREEVIGKTASEVNIWANPQDQTRMVKEMREKGRVVNMEAQFLLKDGTRNTCLLSANIIEIDGENCILSITRDISDRKKAEEAIQVQSAALNAAVNAVTITDEQNRITWANEAFFQMSGYSLEESRGQLLSELVRSNKHDNTFYDDIEKTIFSGKSWQGEIINRRKNGELYPEEMTVTPLCGKDGKISHFVSIKQDISEKKLNADVMKSRVHLLEFSITHNLEELLKETMKEAENLTGSQIGFFHFLEADEKTINQQAWSTRTEENFLNFDEVGLQYPIEKAGVWADCVRERRPIIHNDYASLPNRKGLPSGHASLTREMVVPVFRDNKIVAILGVGNKKNDYTKQDLEVVARLADLVWDVAEKKISDQALLESEQHYREIVIDLDKAQSYAHLGSWTWDISNDQLSWSDEMFRIFGLDRVSFTGKLNDIINQSIHPEDRQKVEESNISVTNYGIHVPLEYRIIRPDKSIRIVWAEAGEIQKDVNGKPTKLSGIVQDITERRSIEIRVEAERELLHLCNQSDNLKDLASAITDYFKKLTNCEAVGMRLHLGDDFPYYETSGFPAAFIEKEKHLCAFDLKGDNLRDSEGNPVLECLCGKVIQEKTNPIRPYFTPNGSFWTNSTTDLTADLLQNEKDVQIRNQCNRAGYESVALIPIRQNTKTFGLFQFNDTHKGHFTPKQIELLEHLANFVAIALAKLETDVALVESEKRYKDLFEHAAIPNLLEDFSGVARIITDIRNQGVTDMRSYFESHPELITECAKQIKVLDVNQACVDFFKVDKKEDLFIQLPSFFTETSWPVFREEVIVLAEGAEYFECDIAARILTGEEKQINLRLNVDPEYSHTLSRVMVSFVDVTERNRAERALEKRVLALTQPLETGAAIAFDDLFNLEEIQKIQDEFARATGVASLILYPDGRAITRPSNFCRLCNDIIRKTKKGQANCLRSDAFIGKINLKGPIIQPCLSGGLWDAGAAIMVGGQHVASWLVGQVRDETQSVEDMKKYAREIGVDEKEFIEAFFEVTPMSQERFKLIADALFAFANQLSTMAYQNVQQARFISERDRAEKALKNTEIHFQSLIENAPDGIALIDQNGRFKYVSPSGRKNFGYDIGEEILISPNDVTHPDDLPAVLTVLNEVIQNPLAKPSLEYRFKHKNGSYLWIESTFSNLFNIPSVEAIVINFRDITARREAEIKIQEQLDELRRWHENTLGREIRVIELKEEVNQVLEQTGQPPRYAKNPQMEQKND